MIGMSCDPSGLKRQTNQTIKFMDGIRSQAIRLAYDFHPVVQERTPKKTGETARSWTIHFLEVNRETVSWEINPDGKEDIVTFLEFGTKPHIIAPERGGVLVFEVDGETVFARYVFHPGTKPLGFVRQTQDEVDEAGLKLVESLHRFNRSIWL